MKKKFYFSLFLLFILVQFPVFGVHSTAPPVNTEDHPVLQAQVSLNRAQLESQLGRKLTFKERIGLTLLKSGIAKDKKHHSVTNAASAGGTNGLAIAGFVLGLVSFVLRWNFAGNSCYHFQCHSLGADRKER
jgi:hypothetical protein